MAKKFKKGIGDTTSFTIPKNFTHTKTMEEIEVNDVHLNFISKNLEDRKLVHAILSAIHDYIHSNNQSTATSDMKLDEILNELKALKSAGITLKTVESNEHDNIENEAINEDDVNDILGDFGE